MKTKSFLTLSFLLFTIAGIRLIAQPDKIMDDFITGLLNKMTLDEKLKQLYIGQLTESTPVVGIVPPVAGTIHDGEDESTIAKDPLASLRKQQSDAMKARVPIPVMNGKDVIHGFETIFPIPLALACTWDLELIEKSARIAAVEASTSGISWTYSPMVDIARDPRWGRIAEGAGEDPWWGSQIAKAMVRGYQGNDLSKPNTILACVKHFALYGAAEAGRDYNTVDMSKITMFNDYLPPYRAAFEQGAGSAMSSFNVVDFMPATGNKWLLNELLRTDWGFEGFIVTDYGSIREMINHGMGDLGTVTNLAIQAGIDMDMESKAYPYELPKLFKEGKVTMAEIDLACRRVLEAKYKLGLFDDPYRYIDTVRLRTDVLSPENLMFAREIAARSCVLLKNSKQILPLKKSGIIAVVGPMADSKTDMLGCWAFPSEINRTVTVVEGIRNIGGNNLTVLYARGSNPTDDPFLASQPAIIDIGKSKPEHPLNLPSTSDMLKEAISVAEKADVIVAVLGELSAWSGEAASRSDISIPESQKNLLKAMLATGKPVVLVLINGRPLTLEWENSNVDAILEAWQAGTMAGEGIADVLFGNYNPSGKLTATFPRTVGQIPIYYAYENTGRPFNTDDKFTSKYLDIPNTPLYPFGYGLSYTTFNYGDISLSSNMLNGNEILTVKTVVTNTGKYAGEEVVQLYIGDPVASISRPVKELKNFRKIMLQPGESKEVIVPVTTEDLKFYNASLKYDWEQGEFIVFVGSNSSDVKQAKVTWMK